MKYHPLTYVLLTAMLSIAGSQAAHGGLVLAYRARNAIDGSLTPNVAPGVTGQPLAIARSARVRSVDEDGVFRTSRWPRDFSANEYLSFGLASPSPLALDEVGLQLSRSNLGPRSVSVLASVDGGAYQEIGAAQSVGLSAERTTFDLRSSEIDFSKVQSVDFRLYAFDSSSQGNSSRLTISNFTAGTGSGFGLYVSGTQAVPEPTTMALIGVTVLGGVARHLRRGKIQRV